jgi:hypothetical protein
VEINYIPQDAGDISSAIKTIPNNHVRYSIQEGQYQQQWCLPIGHFTRRLRHSPGGIDNSFLLLADWSLELLNRVPRMRTNFGTHHVPANLGTAVRMRLRYINLSFVNGD